MVGLTNEDVDDIFSDVFDIAIVWFGVSASDGIGKETFFMTSTEAGIVPKTVNTCRLPLVKVLPRAPLEFDVSSSPERSSSHFSSPFERRDDDATVCVPISLASSSSSRPMCEQSVSASASDDDDDAPTVRLVALQSRRGLRGLEDARVVVVVGCVCVAIERIWCAVEVRFLDKTF